MYANSVITQELNFRDRNAVIGLIPVSESIEWKYLSYGKNLSAKTLMSIMQEFLPDANVICDIGCGAGGLSHFLNRYIGVELDYRSLKAAKESRSNDRHHFVCCDAEYMPIKMNSVDFFLSVSLLEHTNRPGKIIEEVFRVSNGRGIFVLPCRDTFSFIYDPVNYIMLKAKRKPFQHGAFGYGHINVLSKDEWTELIMKAGFRIDKVLPYDDTVLTQIEFFIFSLFTGRCSQYSDLPVRTVSYNIYRCFQVIHKIMRLFDMKTRKSFGQCFIVTKC